ncbi:hypothetical protein Bca4012_010351 [Brassica carinata]
MRLVVADWSILAPGTWMFDIDHTHTHTHMKVPGEYTKPPVNICEDEDVDLFMAVRRSMGGSGWKRGGATKTYPLERSSQSWRAIPLELGSGSGEEGFARVDVEPDDVEADDCDILVDFTVDGVHTQLKLVDARFDINMLENKHQCIVDEKGEFRRNATSSIVGGMMKSIPERLLLRMVVKMPMKHTIIWLPTHTNCHIRILGTLPSTLEYAVCEAAAKNVEALTPKITEVLAKNFIFSTGYAVNHIINDEYEVVDGNGMYNCVDHVNLEKKRCFWKEFEALEIPCVHEVVTSINAKHSVKSKVAIQYSNEYWGLAYGLRFNPLDHYNITADNLVRMEKLDTFCRHQLVVHLQG